MANEIFPVGDSSDRFPCYRIAGPISTDPLEGNENQFIKCPSLHLSLSNMRNDF